VDYSGGSAEPRRELGPAKLLWPNARFLPLGTPRALAADFEEADRCFARGDYTASAIMVRRCVEGLANELDASGKDLFAKIRSLSASGAISDQLAEWANALREVGNEAAHDTSRAVSRQDAEDALVFAEALFEYVYAIKKKYEEFRARRVKKPGS